MASLPSLFRTSCISSRDLGVPRVARRQSLGASEVADQLSSSLAGCKGKEQWPLAMHLLHEFRKQDATLDLEVYSQVIGTCQGQATRSWRHVLWTFDLMRKSGVTPDRSLYGFAVSACTGGNKWKRAVSLLGEMLAQDWSPEVSSYTSAIALCTQTGHRYHASTLMRNARIAAVMPHEKAIPNILSSLGAWSNYDQSALEDSIMFHLVPQPGVADWKLAVDLLDCLQQSGERADATAYDATMSQAGEASQWDAMKLLACDMRVKLVDPTAMTYNLLGRAVRNSESVAEAERWEEATGLLSEMLSSGLEPNIATYEDVMATSMLGSKWELVLELLDDCRSRVPRLSGAAVAPAIQAWGRESHWRQAFHLLQESYSAETATVATANAMLEVCLKSSRWELGVALLQELRDGTRHLEPSQRSFMVAIQICHRNSRLKLADHLTCVMVEDFLFRKLDRRALAWFKQDNLGRSPWKTTSQLDLHRMPAQVAVTAVRVALNVLLADGEVPSADFTIITGKGKHSKGGAVIRPRILQLLQNDLGLKEIRVNPKNAGTIIVPKNLLQKIQERGGLY
ncbi:unnamed protein product, partial [Polarella glacialis]